MPVFFSGEAVALDVADKFGIYFCCGVETERGFDYFVLEVAVDSLGASDDLNACTDVLVIFSEYSGVGVGVVATDDHEGRDAELLEDFKAFVELFLLFEFCTA